MSGISHVLCGTARGVIRHLSFTPATIQPPTLTTPATLRPPTLTTPVTLRPPTLTFAMCPCPRATTIPTLMLFYPTVSHIGGTIGVWLQWCFGPLSLLPAQWGGLPFCHHLIMMLLTLAVQVPNAYEGQWRRGH